MGSSSQLSKIMVSIELLSLMGRGPRVSNQKEEEEKQNMANLISPPKLGITSQGVILRFIIVYISN